MKNFNVYKLTLVVGLVVAFSHLHSHVSAQATFQTVAGGDRNWSTAATWSLVSGTDDDAPTNIPDGDDIVIINSGHDVDITTTVACLNLTLNGTGRIDFDTNSQTLTVNGDVTMNGTSSFTGNNNNRVLNLLGDLTIPSGQQGSIGGIRVTQPVTESFNVYGTFVPSDNTGVKNFGDANFYNGCFINGTATEAFTIDGDLVVHETTAGLKTRLGNVTLTVNGTTTIANGGYLEFSASASGTKRFNDKITVDAGGTWDNIIGEDPFINCDIENNGLWPVPTGGTGIYEADDGGSYTISGTAEIGMSRVFADDGSTLTNIGILHLTGTDGMRVDDGGEFINGTGGYLKLSMATNTVNIGGGGSSVDFSAPNNTVEYGYLGDQEVYGTTYDILILKNGGIKETDNADLDINNEFRIEDVTIFEQEDNDDITGTANLIMTGTSVYRIQEAGTLPQLTGTAHSLAAGTTIEYYGGSSGNAQTAASSASYPYANILITDDTSLNLSLVSNIGGNLTLEDDAVFTTNPVLAIGGILTYNSNSTTTLSNNITTGSAVFTDGTLNYSSRTITINGTDGVWQNDGGAFTTNATSKVLFTTGTGQLIQGPTATTFQDLEVNNANGITLDGVSATVSSDLVLTAGRIITGNNVVVMSTGAAVSRTSGFVEGNLRKNVPTGASSRTFEVGTNTDYTPVTFTFAGVTTSNTFTVSATAGDHPEISSGLIEPNNTVNRYWSVTNNGIVFSAFSTGQVAATFTYAASDKDAALDNAAIPKWYNNTTTSWTGFDQLDEVAEQNPVMTASTNTGANTASFAVMSPTQLTSGVRVDFQIGEKIDPTFIYNRLTGSNNWSNQATWIQQRTGTISTAGSSTTITGSSTLFLTELQVGDVIMLLTTPGTTHTITNIFSNTSLQISAPVNIAAPSGYGRQRVPNGATDFVVIGNTSIADATTTITLDQDATILSLTLGSIARNTAHSLVHQAGTARNLTIGANVFIDKPASSGVTNLWNIGIGSASVAGDLTLGNPTGSTNSTRTARISISTGTLTARNIRYRTTTAADNEDQAIIDMSGGAGTLNISGAVSFSNNRGGLIPGTTSTINFNGSTTAQTFNRPSGNTTAADWSYNNLRFNNTHSGGITMAQNVTLAAGATDGTQSRVAGDFRIQSGILYLPSFNVDLTTDKTFEVSNGATFEMISTNASGAFPTFSGDITPSYVLGATSNVIYNQDNNHTIRGLTYGNLSILNNRGASTRTYTLANSAIVVAGNFVLSDGTNTTILNGGGSSSKLRVNGNFTISTGGQFTLTANGNFSTANDGIDIYGNWTNNGSFTTDANPAAIVQFSKTGVSAVQTIGGTGNTFYNLRINTGDNTGTVQMTGDVNVSNILTLARGGLDLNGNTLNLTNAATTAISRTAPAYIKSENTSAPYGTIAWTINNVTGSFVYPFGVSATEYIPFTFNVTSAGNAGAGDGTVSVSTYASAADNTPTPTGVTNLNGTSGGASVADRYWVITCETPVNFATTRPTATLTFAGRDSEKPTTPITTLQAQRWSPANYWDEAAPGQTYNDSPTIGAAFWTVQVPGISSFSPWTVTESSVPLPIELVEFKAEVVERKVVLNWVTASEFNNDYFVIERTTDGEYFSQVEKITGAGTTNDMKEYSTYDYQPVVGRSYYRLKQVDFDGKFTYSDLVMVEVADVDSWSIYPNPYRQGELNLIVTGLEIDKPAKIYVRDMQGHIVFEKDVDAISYTIVDITPEVELPVGMYMVSIVIGNDTKHVKLLRR